MEETGFEERELIGYLPALYAFSKRFVRNESDADDLVQETVSKALAYTHLFRRGTRLKSWLFTIMRNTFLNEVQKTKREHPGSQECVSDRGATDPSQEWAVRLREVEEAMKTLSPEFQSAVMAAYVGDSCEDTAIAAGCAVGTIKSRTSRARHQILVEMGARGLDGNALKSEQYHDHSANRLVPPEELDGTLTARDTSNDATAQQQRESGTS